MSQLQEALLIAKKAQQDINALLSGPTHVHNLLSINANFKQIESRLVFMGGVLEPDQKRETNSMFPPITNFMGEDVSRPVAITAADLDPNEAERRLFISKVEKLESVFDQLTPEAIMHSYTMPEDVMVLRAVAKRAGVKEFENRAIDPSFIDDIAAAMKANDELAAKQRDIDASLQQQQPASPEPIVITQEMIDGDEELRRLKAVSGDLLSFGPKGGKKITKPSAQQ